MEKSTVSVVCGYPIFRSKNRYKFSIYGDSGYFKKSKNKKNYELKLIF